jgi:TRAP-type mannitol/chloroaromatic compound transport system permease small subunit
LVPGVSAAAMPKPIRLYVRYVDAANLVLGNVVMYLVLVMLGVLLFGSLTRYVFNVPVVWVIEMAQFLMAAYFILGGGYSMQLDSHVRMDVWYERWKPKTRAVVDSITAFFLVFYLTFMVYGGFSSTAYSLKYGQTNYSAWGAPRAPHKKKKTVGVVVVVLEAVAMLLNVQAEVIERGRAGGTDT